MKVEAMIMSNHRPRLEIISDAIVSIDLDSSLSYSPSKCTIRYLRSDTTWALGSMISLVIDGVEFFQGYIFEHNYTEDNLEIITCYDQLRYWKGEDLYVADGKKLEDVFNDINKSLGLKGKVIHPTGYTLPYNVWDNTTYWQVWKDGVERCLNDKGEDIYFVRDNFGTIEMRGLQKTAQESDIKILLSDNPKVNESKSVMGYNYTRSIDKRTYNSIKIINENAESKEKVSVLVQDDESVGTWGKLTKLERSSEELSKSEIEKRAKKMLDVYDRWSNDLSIQIVGTPDLLHLRAGDGLVVMIQDLYRFNYDVGKTIYGKSFAIESITHTISCGQYNISVNLFIR